MLASERGHTAIVQLLLEAGADKEAKDKVRERENHTHQHIDGLERRHYGLSRSWEFGRSDTTDGNEYFCWKCTVLKPWLNRVGCEFWHLSRTCKGYVSLVRCRQIFIWASEHLHFQIQVFANLFCFFAPARALIHVFYYPSHAHTSLPLNHFVSIHFPLVFFLVCSLFCYYGTPLSMFVQEGWTALMRASFKGHAAIVQLLLEAGANMDAKNEVRERIPHTCGWQDCLWRSHHGLSSHRCSWVYMCALGLSLPALFFSSRESPSWGFKCKENLCFLFVCVTPSFS